MALVSRISRLFKADFHAVLDQIEEPEQLLRQAIREMEDELAAQEQRIRIAEHDQEALGRRISEIDATVSDIDDELGLCFAASKDDLARSLVRKKIEAERLLKLMRSRYDTTANELTEQRTLLAENRGTLEALRQKAELFAQTASSEIAGETTFDDHHWVNRELHVSDDEVEIAFLREQERRQAS
jgi:phage shock protein A